MMYDEMVATGFGYVRCCGSDYLVSSDRVHIIDAGMSELRPLEVRHCPGCRQPLSGRVRDAETTIAEESTT